MPTAKSDVDPIFEQQLKALQAQAGVEYVARPAGAQSLWMMPDANGWKGDLFDFDGMEKPFDRTMSNGWFVDAIKDVKSSGVTGDMLVTTTQIDYLAIMERSFRMRHTSRRPRAILHAMSRKAGHGSNNGPLVQAVLEYVRALVKRTKGAQLA